MSGLVSHVSGQVGHVSGQVMWRSCGGQNDRDRTVHDSVTVPMVQVITIVFMYNVHNGS